MRFYWSGVLLLVSNFFFCGELGAQKENSIWYFGEFAGLDFNISPPIPLKGKLSTREGCATIADPNGDLLFYTDGITIWDRIHRSMPNGNGLLGGLSSTQSALIVPLPHSCTKYYVFAAEDNFSDGGLTYSIVDMSLHGGYGDVITETKNSIVVDSACEKLTAILHSNGQDIWILTHTLNSKDFYAFLLTENGLNTSAVISSVGAEYGESGNWPIGPIRSSHDGTKIIVPVTFHSICEMFDFNTSTGEITNPFNLYSLFDDERIYGVEFSQNDSLLYLTCASNSDEANYLLQINIKDPQPHATTIFTFQETGSERFGTLQLGIDQKIYLARRYQSYLGVIHQPNQQGIACQYEEGGAILLPETISHFGLPNPSPYSFCPFLSLGPDKTRCIGDSVVLGTTFLTTEFCPVSVMWFDGTSDLIKTITSSGDYWCDVTTNCSTYRDSIRISFDAVLFSLLEITLCEGETYEGHAESGVYIDTISSSAGCDSISTLVLTITPRIHVVVEKMICEGNIFEGYTMSGIYRDTFQGYQGCDSIRILRLSVIGCKPIIAYDLDLCHSVMSQGTHMDYSEFTPQFPNTLLCAQLDADILYRAFPEKHSCTPGMFNSPAMCVTALDTCEYLPGHPSSIVIEFTIIPLPDSLVKIAYLDFYEQAPLQYNWINGPSGENNRPHFYGIRILKNGLLVYQEEEIQTDTDWDQQHFSFVENESFTVDSIAHFRIELLPYCLTGNGSEIAVWDIEEITISGGCVSPLQERLTIDGFIMNKYNEGMPGVDVEISSDPHFTQKQISRTNEVGYYSFKVLKPGNSYYLRGSKNDDSPNGVNVSDLILIQKHLLGISPFSTLEQLVSADVIPNKNINVLDLIALQKLLLGKYIDFPDNTSWRFMSLPQDFTVLDLNLLQEIKYFEALQFDQHSVNFRAIKVGDVNGTARYRLR